MACRDKDVDCRDKDILIRDLKEKIVKFSSFVRHLEFQKEELLEQVKAQVSRKHLLLLLMSYPF